VLSAKGVESLQASLSLRVQALLEFGLPVAPERIEELAAPVPSTSACRIQTPEGRFLLLCAAAPLALAFEATFFDLLVEAHFPVPGPRRARGGGLIAVLKNDGAPAAASCYAWPPGETLDPATARTPQLLEIGRLLGRLHRLGEAHPASVPEPLPCRKLAEQLGGTDERLRDALLELELAALPAGAAHGHLGPAQALYLGDRCSAVLPSGAAHSGPLVLDLARAAEAWALGSPEPIAAIRAVVSGYQAERRLLFEERESFGGALRCAAAQEGVRRLAAGKKESLAPLHALEALDAAEIRAATG
jgi:Ser/Thr protein kinase RdoA (MazF antagonist)